LTDYGKGSVTVSDWYSVESDSFYTAPVVNAKYEVVAKALRSAYNTNDRNNVKITFSSGYQSNGLAKTTPRVRLRAFRAFATDGSAADARYR
jgi:hypothetical protein